MMVNHAFTSRLIYLAFRKAQKFMRDTQDPNRQRLVLWDDIWNEIGDSKHWREHRPVASPELSDFPLSAYNDYKDTIEESYRTGESLLTRIENHLLGPVQWHDDQDTQGLSRDHAIPETNGGGGPGPYLLISD